MKFKQYKTASLVSNLQQKLFSLQKYLQQKSIGTHEFYLQELYCVDNDSRNYLSCITVWWLVVSTRFRTVSI